MKDHPLTGVASDPSPDAQRVTDAFIEQIPHARALGFRLVSVGGGIAEISMPWAPQLVGDPSTGVIAGGAVSTLMDTCCGAAVMSIPEVPGRTATLDLRIDYMRPATPGQTITARAEVYQLTRSIAFLRAIATDEDSSRPVASATGAFTVGTL